MVVVAASEVMPLVVVVSGRLVVMTAVMFVHSPSTVKYEQEQSSPDNNDAWSPLKKANGPLR